MFGRDGVSVFTYLFIYFCGLFVKLSQSITAASFCYLSVRWCSFLLRRLLSGLLSWREVFRWICGVRCLR